MRKRIKIVFLNIQNRPKTEFGIREEVPLSQSLFYQLALSYLAAAGCFIPDALPVDSGGGTVAQAAECLPGSAAVQFFCLCIYGTDAYRLFYLIP
jgi:hypothetical protein